MNTELRLEMVPSNATTCLSVRLGVWGWHPLALLTVDMTSSTLCGWCLWRSCRCICRWYHGCLKWCHYVWGWSHCSLGWCHNLLQCFEVTLWAAMTQHTIVVDAATFHVCLSWCHNLQFSYKQKWPRFLIYATNTAKYCHRVSQSNLCLKKPLIFFL